MKCLSKMEEDTDSSKKRASDLDSLLDRYVGRGGPQQWRQFALLLLQGLASTVPFYLHLFAAATPEHRCFVLGCDANNNNDTMHNRWTEYAIPKENGGNFLRDSPELAQCLMFQRIQHGKQLTCTKDDFSPNQTTLCQDEFVFDHSRYEATLVTDLNLVCNDRKYEKLLGSVMMAGLTVGCFVGGPLGDKLGRRTALLSAIISLAPLVVVGGFVPSYELYAVLRLFSYVCVSIMWISSHALILELFGSRWRKLAYVANSVWLCLVNLVLVVIIYFERHWTYMHLWVGAVVTAAIPPLALCLEESVRWLAVNERIGEAEARVRAMVKSAGVELDEEDSEDISEILKNLDSAAKEQDERKLSFWNLFGKTYLKQTLAILSAWISSVVAYYAIALNATTLAGDPLLNFALSSLADVPSSIYVLAAVDMLGRRVGLALPLCILSACCVTMAFVSKEYSKIILTMFLVGKFSSSCALNVVWLFTAELYPTNLRVQAVGTCSLISRIFGALAPFVEDLSGAWQALPFLLLGIPALVAALLTFLVKETNKSSLPDIKSIGKDEDVAKSEAQMDKNISVDSKLMEAE